MKKTLLMVAFLLMVFGATKLKAQSSLFLEASSCVTALTGQGRAIISCISTKGHSVADSTCPMNSM